MTIEWIPVPRNGKDGSPPFDGNPILVLDKRFYALVVRWNHLNQGFSDHYGAMVSYPEMYVEI